MNSAIASGVLMAGTLALFATVRAVSSDVPPRLGIKGQIATVPKASATNAQTWSDWMEVDVERGLCQGNVYAVVEKIEGSQDVLALGAHCMRLQIRKGSRLCAADYLLPGHADTTLTLRIPGVKAHQRVFLERRQSGDVVRMFPNVQAVHFQVLSMPGRSPKILSSRWRFIGPPSDPDERATWDETLSCTPTYF